MIYSADFWMLLLIALELYAILAIELISRAPELPWHD